MSRGLQRRLPTVILALCFLLPTTDVRGQERVLLPEGTVITVTTHSALLSAEAREGDPFRSTVVDSVRVEGFTAIPPGSTIDGVVTLARRANDRSSGVIGVEFTGLRLPDGSSLPIDGKLTSTDPGERRQIDAQPNAQVLFVGGRSGPGAAIGAMAGSGAEDPVAGVFGALGTLLSKGVNVSVPAGTRLAVQLERGISMVALGREARRPDAFTIYTSIESIKSAQRVLSQKGYYRGPIDGILNDGTQRALVEYQIAKGIIVTGNLDGRTATSLGLQMVSGPAPLTPDEASLLRRNAQSLAVRYRDYLGISEAGRLDPRRAYDTGEVELYFVFSAFADNASIYEQIVRLSGNVEGTGAAGHALAAAARRVDAAMRHTRVPSRTATGWGIVQQDVAQLDSTYAQSH